MPHRLWLETAVAATVQLDYVSGKGWTAVVRIRCASERWSEAHQELYDGLSVDELLQVVLEELEALRRL